MYGWIHQVCQCICKCACFVCVRVTTHPQYTYFALFCFLSQQACVIGQRLKLALHCATSLFSITPLPPLFPSFIVPPSLPPFLPLTLPPSLPYIINFSFYQFQDCFVLFFSSCCDASESSEFSAIESYSCDAGNDNIN